MHRQQLRKKAPQPIPPGSIDRPSRHPSSYPKTRIRGSRLLNAARILALIELSRRLHQAYRHAYDKQTADRLLPQNTAPNENAIRNGLNTALSNPECAKLIDALLNAVATKKNPLVSQYGEGGIMGMFEAVMLEDGLTRNVPPGSAGHGSPIGNIAQGNAAIFVEARPFGPADQLQSDTKGVLGELMHLGGEKKYYTDRAFAEVVHRDYPGLTTSIWPGDKNYKFHKDAMANRNHIGWSYYWHQAVNRKCF